MLKSCLRAPGQIVLYLPSAINWKDIIRIMALSSTPLYVLAAWKWLRSHRRLLFARRTARQKRRVTGPGCCSMAEDKAVDQLCEIFSKSEGDTKGTLESFRSFGEG